MPGILENRATREWRESQEAKAQTDDNFIDEDSDSQIDLVIMNSLTGAVLRRMRALVQFGSNRGWFAVDRMGRAWAVSSIDEGVFELDLHGRRVKDIMAGIGWQRAVLRR
jgi:hypothetical protein